MKNGWQGARRKYCQGERGQVDTTTIENERSVRGLQFFAICMETISRHVQHTFVVRTGT
jgi:hypothetical protein